METDKNKETKITKEKHNISGATAGKHQVPILISILPVLSVVVAILPFVINNRTNVSIAKLGILTLLLTGAVTFYIHINADNILNKKWAKSIIAITYLGSICLLLLIPNPDIYCFWMLGGLTAGMLIDNTLGLLYHFNLSFLLGLTFNLKPETVIQLLILGVLMNMLSGALKQRATVIYASIIILSTNITLSFTINNFIFYTTTNYNYLHSFFTVLTILVGAYFLNILYEKSGKIQSINASSEVTGGHKEDIKLTATELEPENKAEETQPSMLLESYENSSTIGAMQITDNTANYDILCDHGNELLKRLKEHSVAIYNHSLHIGELSSRAAMEIGANERLALAGGLYHEIGKINGKNYIEEGLLLAQEYSFPKELKAILKEHNIKYEKPHSVEAAIVMLSDNVVSTIEYIEKSEEHKFTTDKIIDNIFQMRVEKGTFDSCGLSLMDYKKLKDFYQKEFRKQ